MNPAISLPPSNIARAVYELLVRATGAAAVADAYSLSTEAWELAEQCDDLTRAAAGHVRCFYMYRSGRLAESANFGVEVLPFLRRVALPNHLSEVLRWTGFSACETGDFTLAIDLATESYRIAEGQADMRGRIIAMTLLGGVFERSGDPWQAERIMRNALELAREFKEPYPLVTSLNNLGAVLIGKFYTMRDSITDREEAERVLHSIYPLVKEAVALAPTIEDAFILTLTRGNLGEVLVHLEQYDEAESLLSTVFDEAVARGYRAIQGRVKCSLGELLLARGDYAGAIETLVSIRALPTVQEHVATQLRLHFALYIAYRTLGNDSLALVELEQFRLLESRRSIEQLRAKSELMVTRFEADENKRRSIEQAYELARQQAKRAAALQKLALQDDLTGLPNRRALDARMSRAVERARESTSPLSVVMIDIDRFKSINDRFGHLIGDRTLNEVAAVLRATFRSGDFIARTGGEEFVVVLEDTDLRATNALCEAFRTNLLEHSWAKLAAELFVTASVGIACSPPGDLDTLLSLADQAMYRAKESGRNRA
ncbi:MAG: GGDEF domain-containing protein, partial [Burkholderiales bacterium]